MKLNQKGFGALGIIIIIVVVAVIAGVGFLAFGKKDKKPAVTINSYKTCVAAGNPIMKSYPSQCAANGKTYYDPDEKAPLASDEFVPKVTANNFYTISEWGVKVKLTDADKLTFTVDNSSKSVWGAENTTAAFPEFIAGSLQDKKSCGIGLILYRSPGKVDGFTSKKVGDYYYWVTGNSQSCGNKADQNLKLQFLHDFIPENVQAL